MDKRLLFLAAVILAAGAAIIAGVNFQHSHTSGNNRAATHGNEVQNRSRIYAALGDSIASGEGLAPASEPDTAAHCSHSSQSYPAIIARQTGLKLIDASCSGSRVAALYKPYKAGEMQLPAQLDTAYAKGTPQLITITSGANDTDWIPLMRSCIAADCATAANRQKLKTDAQTVSAGLQAVLSSIRKRSGSNLPAVIVTGYYNPISSVCKGRLPTLTNAEVGFLNDQLANLNRAIRQTAERFSFAKYAPADFGGHSECSLDPWVQLPKEQAPLHPNAAGQRQIAKSVLKTLSTPSAALSR